MTESNYISEVCRQNSLSETVDWLLQSGDDDYHVDRHVDLPPDGIPARAACSAGLALLSLWEEELEKIHRHGIYSERPILIIDQEWLDEILDAPPPHIILTLSKHKENLKALEINGQEIEVGSSPIEDLLSKLSQRIKVMRIEPCVERESRGCWLFQFATLYSESPA